jgi:tetratricopeptide (TPR) repeat protein
MACVLSAACGVAPALAQPEVRLPSIQPERKAPVATPDLAPPVLKLLEAQYLSEDERKSLRIFHGVSNDTDLDTPTRRAGAALIRGTFDDPVLADAAVPIEDRAEAAMMRGDLESSLTLLGDSTSLRAVRIRAQCLEGLGRADDAAKTLEPLIATLKSQPARAPDLVEGVRALIIRSRVHPQDEPAGGDFQRMESLLAAARDHLDRLYWPASAVEADLLFDKDNNKDAGAAAMRALSLCPSSAQAWYLVGRLSVDNFNFDGAEEVAARLQKLDAPSSPLAAIILARVRLRQNDPDGADQALRPAIDRYPKMRSLLAVQAAVAALRYDFDQAEAFAAAFDKLSPGSPDALFEIGKTLSEARQYDKAEEFLTRAAARAPFRAEPVAELGLLGLQSGRDLQALDTLRKAAALDPFNDRVGNSLKLVEELATFKRVESDHFIVRYKPGPDSALATDMLTPLETMYQRVTGKGPGGIDHQPKGKTVIDLMPDARAFAVRIAGVTRIHTMAASTGPTIAMESPRDGPGHSIGTYDWLRVVRHEFTHTVTLSRTRNRIPHWFTEAAAVYLEDAPRDYNTCRLLEGALDNDALFDFSQINLGFIRPRKRTDRPLAYAQGHWMYQYMIERWGERAPLDLMDHYAQGQREDAAMRAVLGEGQSQFLEDFKAWAHTQVAAWGMVPREGQPTMAEILLEESTTTDDDRKSIQDSLDQIAESGAWAIGGGGGEAPAFTPHLVKPDKAMVERWLEKFPDHPDLLEADVHYTLAAADDKPTPEMVPLLERYASARPVDPLPHQMLARLYLAASDDHTIEGKGPEGAIPHLEWLDAREQNSASYAAELARRYAALQDWPKADAKATRATTIAPFDADYRELAATIALQHQDYATALRHITALTIIEPGREIHKKRLEAIQKMMKAQ